MTDPEHERQKWEFRAPLAAKIRQHAMADEATPTDRLAAAVLLLAMEVHDHAVLMTTPVIVTETK